MDYMAHNKEKYISKKNVYDTKIGAINYLVGNTVYSNEWTGTGMYEAIVKIIEAPEKTRFSKEYLNTLLEIADSN